MGSTFEIALLIVIVFCVIMGVAALVGVLKVWWTEKKLGLGGILLLFISVVLMALPFIGSIAFSIDSDGGVSFELDIFEEQFEIFEANTGTDVAVLRESVDEILDNQSQILAALGASDTLAMIAAAEPVFSAPRPAADTVEEQLEILVQEARLSPVPAAVRGAIDWCLTDTTAPVGEAAQMALLPDGDPRGTRSGADLIRLASAAVQEGNAGAALDYVLACQHHNSRAQADLTANADAVAVYLQQLGEV